MARELEFLRPVRDLERQIAALEGQSAANPAIGAQIRGLRARAESLERKIFEGLTRWQTVQIARHPARPSTLDYLDAIFEDFTELHGDRHFGDDAVAIGRTLDNTLDVRGQRVDEAQKAVEDFVAEAMANDQDVVLILHGHGSGALRKAVREHLRRLEHVRRQRGGLAAEGGEGVTVAWID